MFKSPATLSSAIEEMVTEIIFESNGKMRIALNENDISKALDEEAQKFLKVNEKRLGRDFKAYDLMASTSNNAAAFSFVLKEIVLPLKYQHTPCYKKALDYMENNASIVGVEHKKDWCMLIQELRS